MFTLTLSVLGALWKIGGRRRESVRWPTGWKLSWLKELLFWPLLQTDVKSEDACDARCIRRLPPHTLVEGLVDHSCRNWYGWRACLAIFSSLRSENVEKAGAQQNFGGSCSFFDSLPRVPSTCHPQHHFLGRPPSLFPLSRARGILFSQIGLDIHSIQDRKHLLL